MTRAPRPRKTVQLSNSLHQRLNAYALAAGAAGVGALALASPANAEIVYTPTHVIIGPNHRIFIDLDNDSDHDFVFKESVYRSSRGNSNELVLRVTVAYHGNGIRLANGGPFASAIPAGVRIGGGTSSFAAAPRVERDYYGTHTGGSGRCFGPWTNVKNHYLGLKFISQGQVHYGWARLSVTCTALVGKHLIRGLLTGYAYETIPNKPIIAGKTIGPEEAETTASTNTHSPVPTLGTLALGALGLAIWKREDDPIAAP